MHLTQVSPSNTAGTKHWANQNKGLTHSCSEEQAERLWLTLVTWFKQSLSTLGEGFAVQWLPVLPHCHNLMLGFTGLVKGSSLVSQLRRKLTPICVCLKLTWIFPDLHLLKMIRALPLPFLLHKAPLEFIPVRPQFEEMKLNLPHSPVFKQQSYEYPVRPTKCIFPLLV